jgi:ankyrin repeat protein
MPLIPSPTPLPRLEVPSKGWLWRSWHRLKSHPKRRLAFARAIFNETVDDDERLARMRALVDIGLWGDHHETQRKQFKADVNFMAFDVKLAMRQGLCIPEVLHLMFEAGINPNWRENNNYDDSLLTLFARHCQKDLLKLALAAGANPRWRDSCGKTPLHIAMETLAGNSDRDVHANVMPIAEHLLASGVDINDPGVARNKEKGSPPIRTAIERWNVELTQWALDRGASLDVVDDYTETPFHWAATVHKGWGEWDCAPFMALLLANGAKPDEPNRRGETPVWSALKWGNADMAEWLVDHGADIHVIPHTFQDPQSYEKPGKKGASLLQILTEDFGCHEETVGLAQKLAGGDRNAWNVMTTHGVPLVERLKQEESPWYAFAQAGQLENSTPTIAKAPARKPRL